MDFEYDSWNRIKQMTYPDGEVVSYQYDLGGQLFAMAGDKFGTPYRIIDSIFYDKFGARALIAYGNGTNTQYEYEPYRRRLAGLQTFSGSSALMDLTYSYDEENNITGISNSAFAVNGLGGNYSYNYEYDNMYRLVNAGGSFTDHQQKNYTFELAMSYSPGGNILSKSMDALTFQSTLGGAVAVNYNNTYEYNQAQPHAIRQISGYNTDQQLEWDANGNLVHHMRNIEGNDLDRRLCWDEENRLTAVRDQNNMSAYIYDAGGDRVWKLTGQVQQMYVDGMGYVDVVDLNNKTLYASPYLVYNEQGYSKHYYAGAERVSSRIGGGMQDALVDPLNSALAHLSHHDDYNAIASDLNGMLIRSAECAGMSLEYLIMDPILGMIYESTGWSNPEENWYIYHSDHLGSSSFLSDASGDPTQHLQYMPFGETFVEQRSVTSYYTPYTFSAKERDLETGYSYFGARYYSSDISVWLSVDPMADKNFGVSPYNYCHWNPINLIDPDGKDDEDPLKNVIIVIRQGNEYTVAKKGNKPGDYKNWRSIVATDIVDAQTQLISYLGDTKLDNIIISSHANNSGLSITEPYEVTLQDGSKEISNELSVGDMQEFAQNGTSGGGTEVLNSLKAFNEIAAMVANGGNLVMTGCYAGNSPIAKAASAAFNKNIHYFANTGKGLVVGEVTGKVMMGPLSNEQFVDQSEVLRGNISIIDNKQKPIIINSK
jgi:RHS repeat-associated protein